MTAFDPRPLPLGIVRDLATLANQAAWVPRPRATDRHPPLLVEDWRVEVASWHLREVTGVAAGGTVALIPACVERCDLAGCEAAIAWTAAGWISFGRHAGRTDPTEVAAVLHDLESWCATMRDAVHREHRP